MINGKKHILYLSSWYPNEHQPHVGNFVKRHALLLSQDHFVTAIHTVASDLETELRVTTSEASNFREIIVYHPRGKSLFSKRSLQKKALKKATESISDADLLVTQILLPKGLQFADVKKQFNCPWIHIEQGSYFRPEVWKDWPITQKFIAKQSEKHIDQFFAVSDFLRKDLQPIFKNTKIDLISNHVDLEAFHPKDKSVNPDFTRFLHISTLDKNTKNPKGMFDACALLKQQRGSSFEFLVISDEETEEWKTYCEQLDISDVVSFDGFKPWKELPAFYQQSDAFILNSVYETFSIVLAEAWATGTPTITTPVGIGYNLPSFLGFQSIINDPNSLAECMGKFIDQKARFDVHKIREKAESYDLIKIRLHINQIIDQHAG